MDLKSRLKKLVKNAIWLFSAEVICKILSYAIIVLLARSLGPKGLREYSFIFYYVGLLGIFSDLGLSFYLMREVSKNKIQRLELFPYILGLKIFLALLNFLIIFLLNFILPKPFYIKFLIILVSMVHILTWLSSIFVNIMYAYNITKYEAIAKVLERGWTFLIGAVALYFYPSLTTFIVVLACGFLLRELIRIKYGMKIVDKVSIRFDLKIWISLLKKSYPFWLIGLFTLIYSTTDIVMISLMKGDFETGIYRAGFSLIEVAFFIPNIIIFVTFPSITELWHNNRKYLGYYLNKILFVIFLLGITGMIGYYAFSEKGILWVFGEKFFYSIKVLKILSFSLPFIFLNLILGSILNAIGKEKAFTKIAGITAVLNIILNYYLIKNYGANGAAIATLISHIVACIFTIAMFLKIRSVLSFQ